MKIKVVIIEDDFDFRSMISYKIDNSENFMLLKAYMDFESFLLDLKKHNDAIPDIMIVDIGLPGMSGIEGIHKINSMNLNIDIIVLTVFNDEQKLFKAMQSGATSYVMKSDSVLNIETILEITNKGGSYMSPIIAKKIQHYFNPIKSLNKNNKLTERENDIVGLLVRGYKYKNIAEELFLSIDTVRYHIKNIYSKLQINSKDEIKKQFEK